MLGLRRFWTVVATGVVAGGGVMFAVGSGPVKADSVVSCLNSAPDGVMTTKGAWPNPTESALVKEGPVAVGQKSSFTSGGGTNSDTNQLLCVHAPNVADITVGDAVSSCSAAGCFAQSDVASVTTASTGQRIGESPNPCVILIPPNGIFPKENPMGLQCSRGLTGP
jgi:hypothetical protein